MNKKGSTTLIISSEVHSFLKGIVAKDLLKMPVQNEILFSTNVSAFEFGISLATKLDLKIEDFSGTTHDISPRGFDFETYKTIFSNTLEKLEIGVGLYLSQLADAGLRHLKQHLDSGRDVVDLL